MKIPTVHQLQDGDGPHGHVQIPTVHQLRSHGPVGSRRAQGLANISDFSNALRSRHANCPAHVLLLNLPLHVFYFIFYKATALKGAQNQKMFSTRNNFESQIQIYTLHAQCQIS